MHAKSWKWFHYYWAFSRHLGRESYRTWRWELFAAIPVGFFVAFLNGNWKDFRTASFAAGITLGCFVVWHIVRMPWLIHKSIHGPEEAEPGWAAGVFGFALVVTLFICGAYGARIIWGLRAHEEIKASTSAPALDETQVKELDAIFGASDEFHLRQYFGFPEMLEMNIAINKARREYFAKTGNPEMDLTPFTGTRQLQFSSAYDINSVRRAPGAILARLDIDSVSVLILSENYSAHKANLLKYENSSRLSPSVTCAIKDFDRMLQVNVDMMQNLLNDMMRKNPDYFLFNSDGSKLQYFGVINTWYWNRFDQLRLLADQIRDNLRKAQGNA